MSDDSIEMHDSMGSVSVPADALYQAQTQRALNNFQISSLRLPAALIRALALIKQSCAEANFDLGKLDTERAAAISSAADLLVAGQHADQFAIDVFQTGSGTSSRHLAQAIESFTVNEESQAHNLALNPILVTALNPLIGYHKAAEIAKAAVQQNRPILEVAAQMTTLCEDELRELLNPENLI